MTFRKPSLLLFCTLALSTLVASAQTVTGTVTNRTNEKAASGDDVVMLKLAQGMQELARTKTDSRGHFVLKVPADDASSLHLVRVTHDRANYFKPAPAGNQKLEIDVYTAAAEVDGITVSEDVMQIQTTPGAGESLRVVEHFLVKNDSQPARTLFSDRPFEIYLPAGATVDGSSAKAPGGMGVEQPLVPLGDPNHYAIIFPIRPGETEFNVWYKLPYKDSYTFQPRPVLPTEALGIMMPKAMNFKGGATSPYKSVSEQVGGKAQAYLARDVKPSQPLDFTVSGKGELPRDSVGQGGSQGVPGAQAGGAGAPGAATAQGDPNTDTRPGGGLGTPLDKDGEHDPWSKYKGWILGGFALVLAAAAGIMLRRPSASTVAAPMQGPGGPLQALQAEMFALETDRMIGKLSEDRYQELKVAFDTVLRRTLERMGQTAQLPR